MFFHPIPMRATYFAASLALGAVLTLWLLARMVVHTDPDVPANVGIVLLLLFLTAVSLIGLVSWGLIRRILGEDRFGMALRHGAWAGLFLVLLPVLRWMNALSFLVLGAVLLIIFGLESLLLLQQEQGEPPAPQE